MTPHANFLTAAPEQIRDETPHANGTTTVSGQAVALPKITPFRLAFILTTTGFGIAKAILVSKGIKASSTTVEWISGVVLALIFQFLGSCEYNDARPRYLDFLFSYDCLRRSDAAITIAEQHPDPNTLRLSDWGRRASSNANANAATASEPNYNSIKSADEWRAIDNPEPHNAIVIITGYRLLVSAVCAAFGLAKMLCGYLGFSFAMETLDWVIAIPLTLGLYFIGLYEERRHRSLRKLFDVNYSSQTVLTFKAALLMLAWPIFLAFCYLWVRYWLRAMVHTLEYSIPQPPPDQTEASVIWTNIFDRGWQVVDFSINVMMFSLGVAGIGGAVWPVMRAGVNYRNSTRSGSLWEGSEVISISLKLTWLLFGLSAAGTVYTIIILNVIKMVVFDQVGV